MSDASEVHQLSEEGNASKVSEASQWSKVSGASEVSEVHKLSEESERTRACDALGAPGAAQRSRHPPVSRCSPLLCCRSSLLRCHVDGGEEHGGRRALLPQ